MRGIIEKAGREGAGRWQSQTSTLDQMGMAPTHHHGVESGRLHCGGGDVAGGDFEPDAAHKGECGDYR